MRERLFLIDPAGVFLSNISKKGKKKENICEPI